MLSPIGMLGRPASRDSIDPSLWQVERRQGRLFMDEHDLAALALKFGTPLHVVSTRTLQQRVADLRQAFSNYPDKVRLHFSYKTNPVPGILSVLHRAGILAEVVDGFELWLARRMGLAGDDIVFNGPNKSDDELRAAIDAEVGMLVVDNLGELLRLEKIAAAKSASVGVGLRICPDIVPRGMNLSSSTGSRRHQFGMDIGSSELAETIARAAGSPHLRLRAIHAHIGSGIHDLRAFRKTAERVLNIHVQAIRAGAQPDRLNLGGGLGTRLSREFTTWEMLSYLGTGKLPRPPRPAPVALFARYGAVLTEALVDGCRTRRIPVPQLVLEPGRALVSDAQILLLTVGSVRQRTGGGRFVLTDGGAMSVSMMFLSEYHAVFLANRDAPLDRLVTVFGRLPSPMDIVYRNLLLPRLEAGDVLAIMDAGAYFTSTATNFGGPRPAIVRLDNDGDKLIRSRERFEDLIRNDHDDAIAP